MYNTLGSSRLPVMSVGSSSSRSALLRALALEPAGSLGAAAVPTAAGLRVAPAALAAGAAPAAAGGVAAAGALLVVSTAGSSCSGRGRARAGAVGCSWASAAPRVSGHRAMRTDSTVGGLDRYTHTPYMVNLLLSRRCARRSQRCRPPWVAARIAAPPALAPAQRRPVCRPRAGQAPDASAAASPGAVATPQSSRSPVCPRR